MEQGPAKVRRRFTAGVRNLGFELLLTVSELATLDTFFNTTTYGGSLSFDYTHPRTLASVTARFTSSPQYVAIDKDNYSVSVELEVLP
jgi:hypothetical protein